MKNFTKFLMVAIFTIIYTGAFAQFKTIQCEAKPSKNSIQDRLESKKEDFVTFIESSGGNYRLTTLQSGRKIATRYPASYLTSYGNNMKITALSILPLEYTDAGTGAVYNNKNFTIELHEGDYITGGTSTQLLSQDITVSELGDWYDFELTTPITINEGKEITVVVVTGGNSAIGISAQNRPGYNQFSNLTWVVDSQGEGWGTTYFGNSTSPEYYAWGIGMVVDVEVSNCDLAASFASDEQGTTDITTLSISGTEDLILYPRIKNNGPDAADMPFEYIIYSGNKVFSTGTLSFTTPLASGETATVKNGANLIKFTASQLDEEGFTGEFTLNFEIAYYGEDGNDANNMATLIVTRANDKPVAEISPESGEDFGEVIIGETEPKTFTLKNTGAGELTVSSVNNLAEPWTTTLTTSSISTINLAAGETHEFTITFAPTEKGEKTGELVITTNGGTKRIKLKGTGVEENSVPGNEANKIKVYPNPSNGDVNISVSEKSVVTVIDAAGRIMESHNLNANSILNLNQSAGVYFIQVESNGKINTQKLIVE